ncbi:MAG: bifunctional phosphoribosylaminoimidazolecarboxamide formyltransferase/IMP cyclohydrolase [Elusimicrobiota bacterium]
MRALLSVTDKKGLDYFAGQLVDMGWDLIATPGTHKYLLDKDIDSKKISDCTGMPCMLDGKVKTLHPEIFAGLLATGKESKELEANNFERIDLICCNPYNIAQTSSREEEFLKNIDIGGIALLRAGAKNYKNVVVVSDNRDYEKVIRFLKNNNSDLKFRKKLAGKAFKLTAGYDRQLFRYFNKDNSDRGDEFSVEYRKNIDLRYGENPHQKAVLYGDTPFTKLDGNTSLSFNNYQDITAGVRAVKVFNRPGSVIVKHTVPCGAALGDNIKEAYLKSLRADPMSAFGGIVILNRKVDLKIARLIKKRFYEVVAAPGFSPEALELLSRKNSLSIVNYRNFETEVDFRKIPGGILTQDADTFARENWETVSKRKPDESEMKDLKFAWKIGAVLKSNSAAIAADNMTLGLGSGETARVDAVKIAVSKMDRVEGIQKIENNLVMASDGFFPFPDSIEAAAEAKVKAIAEPGGSKNDDKVIQAADRLGVSLIFTGRRHFYH